MADLSVTAANVLKGAGASIDRDKLFGETIVAGQSVYVKSDGAYWKAQCDGTAAESGYNASGDSRVGIALNGGAAGQPAAVQHGGSITVGATLTVGQVYVISATAGGIAPIADLSSTNYVTILGVATTTALLNLTPIISGIAKA